MRPPLPAFNEPHESVRHGMTVNPKKLHPYDRPPRRRRNVIPGAPGSAATGFGVVAALWLAAATGIGVLALGLKLLTDFSFSQALGVFDLTFTVDARRAESAFINAVVYGWLSNVGFAAICFMTPRLTGRALIAERWLIVALAIWNLALLGGITGLYVFDAVGHHPLTAFPWWIHGGLVTAAFIVTASFAASAVSALRTGYISLWFAAVALLGLLGLTTINVVISFLTLSEVATALTSAYVSASLGTVWVLGSAIATLYYVLPRASGNPLAASGMALLAFVTWLVLVPFAGLAEVVDTSVPYAFTTIGSVATALLVVPAFLVAMNLLLTLRGRLSLLFGPTPMAFAVIGLAFIVASTLLQGIGALRSVASVVGGTEWTLGAFIFGALGAATFAGLALIEHALPRLLRREWGGGFLSGITLWTAFGGATIAGLLLIGSGLAEGSMLRQAAPPDQIAGVLLPFRVIALGGLGLVALSALTTVVNVFLMYTSGQPAPIAAPAGAAAAGAGH
jgi:cytochrome c oxidase cbb3-type subunit 1